MINLKDWDRCPYHLVYFPVSWLSPFKKRLKFICMVVKRDILPWQKIFPTAWQQTVPAKAFLSKKTELSSQFTNLLRTTIWVKHILYVIHILWSWSWIREILYFLLWTDLEYCDLSSSITYFTLAHTPSLPLISKSNSELSHDKRHHRIIQTNAPIFVDLTGRGFVLSHARFRVISLNLVLFFLRVPYSQILNSLVL